MMLLPLLAFVFASLLVTAAAMAFAGHRNITLDRLNEVTGLADRATAHRPRLEPMIGMLRRVGDRVPRSPKELGKLQLRLVQAGYRKESALPLFFGIRMAAAVAAFLLCVAPLGLMMRPNIMFALGAMGVGYVLPGVLLARMAKRRQHRIRLSLADALDLLVVSVEAGLGLDQAMSRVADELASAYPDLADELRLVNLELRAGKARSEALRNLADRTGVDDLGSLVTMLIQTDKFGTSIAQSLRVFSDTMRTKRRQRAEEAAAKTGVKMVFPLVCCIFPAIWVVTIGPAAIRFMQVIGPMTEK
jgi:tight adherence protein C